mmetsp:Transcript_22108/g.52855  ORF Transcript_22108/g.52855 Transcript_22108/m.52855 type:complete len:320 (-) Transcript_22108:272-1231(-)
MNTPVPPLCYAVIFFTVCHGGWIASRGQKLNKRRKSSSEIQDEHLYLSSLGTPGVLFVYRWGCLFYVLYVCVEQITRIRSFRIYKFYTVWNWYLLFAYFLLAATWSLQWLRQQPHRGAAARPAWRERRRHWTVVLLHVNLTVEGCAGSPYPAGTRPRRVRAPSGSLWCSGQRAPQTVFIVNTFTWLVLVPMMLANPETVGKAKKMFFTFTSYNQHGVNSLLILGDLMLNAIPFQGYMIGYAGMWSGLYSIWAHVNYALHGEWIYVFMDPGKANVIVMYSAVFLAHWAFFGVVWALFKLRDSVAPLSPSKIAPLALAKGL